MGHLAWPAPGAKQPADIQAETGQAVSGAEHGVGHRGQRIGVPWSPPGAWRERVPQRLEARERDREQQRQGSECHRRT